MVYVALLRGINVGGNNKVEMPRLKTVFEALGCDNVKTYINSGNIIFTDNSRKPDELVAILEKAIEQEFGFHVKVLVRDINNIRSIVEALPETWQNNGHMKCDVMFLWEKFDSDKVLDQLIIKPGLDDVTYESGAILWRVDRKDVTRSGLLKIIGTDLYKHMTIRNCNTTRKLLELMNEVA